MNAPIIEVPPVVITPETCVMWPGLLCYEPRPVWDETTGLYEEAWGAAWMVERGVIQWRELALDWRGADELLHAPGVN